MGSSLSLVLISQVVVVVIKGSVAKEWKAKRMSVIGTSRDVTRQVMTLCSTQCCTGQEAAPLA